MTAVYSMCLNFTKRLDLTCPNPLLKMWIFDRWILYNIVYYQTFYIYNAHCLYNCEAFFLFFFFFLGVGWNRYFCVALWSLIFVCFYGTSLSIFLVRFNACNLNFSPVLTPKQVSMMEHILPVWAFSQSLKNSKIIYKRVNLGVRVSSLNHLEL